MPGSPDRHDMPEIPASSRPLRSLRRVRKKARRTTPWSSTWGRSILPRTACSAVVLEIDGETVVKLVPDIGYLHTGIEKTCEAKFYQQVVPLTDRIDYLSPMTNNLCYCLAVEKLLQLEIPERAQWMRVLLNELTRLNSHLIWLGTHAMDIGALTVFLYTFREREDILRIFEQVSGQRNDDLLLPHRRPRARSAARLLRYRAVLHQNPAGKNRRIRESAHRQIPSSSTG